MNNAQIIFLDTGPLVALFNKDEEAIGNQLLEILSTNKSFSRHAVMPCLVELFYLVKNAKRMTPNDVRKNLDWLGVTMMPVAEKISQAILEKYFDIAFKNEFDFADFFLCCVALQFERSLIITIDKRDLPLALAAAQRTGLFPKNNVAQLLPIRAC